MRLWIDTDIATNVDDAVALLAAVAHPAVELLGVSTVGSDPERRAAVAVGLLAGAGVDLGSVAVVAGAPGPADEPPCSPPGQAGAAIAAQSDAAAHPPSSPSTGHAHTTVGGSADVVAGVRASGAEALLAIGPLTNVAAMTAAGVRPPELTIMGGALRPVEHRRAPIRRAQLRFRPRGGRRRPGRARCGARSPRRHGRHPPRRPHAGPAGGHGSRAGADGAGLGRPVG